MNNSDNNFLFKQETHEIIGSAMEVLNILGHGLLEKPYENALCVEFKIKNIPFVQQLRYDVSYKDIKVGEYIPDLIALNRIIIDTKTIDTITNHERGQMLNYLRITHLRVGLIINFKHPRLQWERIAL